MTTFHCDKLCSGPCCAPLMRSLKHKDTLNALDWLVRLSHSDTFAFAAVSDPAKLAELMAMGLRARGVDAIVFHYADKIGTWIRVELEGDGCGRVFSLYKSRAVLAAIISTPADESSKSHVEALIRGEK